MVSGCTTCDRFPTDCGLTSGGVPAAAKVDDPKQSIRQVSEYTRRRICCCQQAGFSLKRPHRNLNRWSGDGRVRQYEHLATLLPLANVAENQGPFSGIMLYSCNRPEAAARGLCEPATGKSAALCYQPDSSGGDGGVRRGLFWRIPMLSGTKSAIDMSGQERRYSRMSR